MAHLWVYIRHWQVKFLRRSLDHAYVQTRYHHHRFVIVLYEHNSTLMNNLFYKNLTLCCVLAKVSLLQKCWTSETFERPTFDEIVELVPPDTV